MADANAALFGFFGTKMEAGRGGGKRQSVTHIRLSGMFCCIKTLLVFWIERLTTALVGIKNRFRFPMNCFRLSRTSRHLLHSTKPQICTEITSASVECSAASVLLLLALLMRRFTVISVSLAQTGTSILNRSLRWNAATLRAAGSVSDCLSRAM